MNAKPISPAGQAELDAARLLLARMGSAVAATTGEPEVAEGHAAEQQHNDHGDHDPWGQRRPPAQYPGLADRA